MTLPYCIEKHLPDVGHVRLFGKPLLEYSKEELVAFIMHQNEEEMKELKEKHRQFKMLGYARGE